MSARAIEEIYSADLAKLSRKAFDFRCGELAIDFLSPGDETLKRLA